MNQINLDVSNKRGLLFILHFCLGFFLLVFFLKKTTHSILDSPVLGTLTVYNYEICFDKVIKF